MQMRRVPFEGLAGRSSGPAAHAFIHPTKAEDAQSFPVLLRGDILASSNGYGGTMVTGLTCACLRQIDSAWLRIGSI